MNIEIVLVYIKDKEILRDLINEYEKELLGLEKNEEYKYLDSYWQKENRYPYFIKVDEIIVGFVLVNGHVLVQKSEKNIAEFYIKKEFRNKGMGKIAAFKTFDILKGKWEIRELKENVAAQNFWRKVIDEYTKNNYQEILLDNENWSGPVQTFEN